VDLCANTAQPLLKTSVVLEMQVQEGLTYVYSDQDKIRQIVLNLLSNAAKFTHEGRIILSAGQEGEKLRISVSDTGIGISSEALPRLVKEFQQADNTTTRQYGGTGLGLSISRNLAHLLGGDLTVESEPGKGSTFTLIIPIRYESRLAASRTETETIPARESTGTSAPGSVKKRVLVIDDDPDAVYILQENLNQQEYEVLGARNGPEGLERARKQQPDVILLDIVMPGADGWQVMRDLRADPETSSIPVVFLTIVDKKALGLELGAAAYLLKPLNPEDVRETLNRVINGSTHPELSTDTSKGGVEGKP
jgi:CheY-like chemotaxis protein